MDLKTLTEIRREAQNGAVPARVHVQVEAATAKTQREGKPYCELALADACDRMTLRVWNDHPNYKACDSMQSGCSHEFEKCTQSSDCCETNLRCINGKCALDSPH